MEWNGMEWNGMEWNGMECANGRDSGRVAECASGCDSGRVADAWRMRGGCVADAWRMRGGNGMRYAFAARDENNMEVKLDSMIQGLTDDFPR
jgi:hypothetical protein